MLAGTRSRQELSNEYVVAKIGVDTTENERFNAHVILKLWDCIVADPPRSGGPGGRGMYVKIKSLGGVLTGSLSAVSKPNFARKYSLELAICSKRN